MVQTIQQVQDVQRSASSSRVLDLRTVDRSLAWTVSALRGDGVNETVEFFAMTCREQFLALEELRTLARLALDLSGVDRSLFLALGTEGIRGWLNAPQTTDLR